MRPISPWDLARSVDRSALEASRGGSAGASTSGIDDLLAVGGTVVTRACLALVVAGAVVAVLPESWVVEAALVGIGGPVVLTLMYLQASTPAAREVLVASLRDGYRTSLSMLVVVAAVMVRSVGVRLGWVDPQPPPPASWALAAVVALVVQVQTGVLRRRGHRRLV